MHAGGKHIMQRSIIVNKIAFVHSALAFVHNAYGCTCVARCVVLINKRVYAAQLASATVKP